MGEAGTRAWPTGTVTFVVTDIEGSTALCQKLGRAYEALLDEHRAVCRSAFERWQGSEVSCPGDGFLVAFASASAAVSAAADLQRSLTARRWPDDAPLRVRIGVHSGEATLTSTGGTYVGLALHEAARVGNAGHGGQVLLSEATYRLVEHQLPPDVQARALGAHQLAGLDGARHLFGLEGPGLRSDFPALRTESSRRGNLPARAGELLGRDAELAELVASVGERPLTTVLGAGGMGKTRLAVEVARVVEERFADGAWVVDLAPVATPASPEDLASAIGRVLELDVRGPAVLADVLRTRAMLLVLDNCEHVVGPLADVVAALLARDPGARVLATSRERLGVLGEHVVTLDPLTAAPSVALFLARASEVLPGFELSGDVRGDVERICARLDGMPLAIELAARRVNVLSPADILSRLDHRFALLTGGARGAPDRHRTLEAALDWSHSMLDPAEQTMLARLSVFTGGCTLDAAQTVCGVAPLTPEQVLDLLSTLVERSLVEVDRTRRTVRYDLLETVRAYAGDHLARLEEAAAIKAQHLDWYAEVAWGVIQGVLGPGGTVDLEHLAPEAANMSAAVEWARLGGDLDAGLRVAIGAALHWFETGASFLSNSRWLEELLDEGAGANDPELRALAHFGVANSAMAIDDDVVMSRHSEAMLSLVERFDLPPAVRGTALMMVAYTHREDAQRTVTEMREAADLHASAGAAGIEAFSRSLLSEMALRAGDIDVALAAGEEGLEAARRSALPMGIARCLTRLAHVAVARNDAPTAVARAGEALAVARAAGASTEVGLALIAWGEAAAVAGDLPRSGELLVEAAAEFSRHGYQSPPVRIFATVAVRSIATAAELSARWALARLDEVIAAGVPTDPASTAALASVLSTAVEHGREDLVADLAERVHPITSG